jgi:hypothetical protein
MELLYYTAMKNLLKYRDIIFLLFSATVFSLVLFNVTTDFLKTKAAASSDSNPWEVKEDPSKDFKSLDNYISYISPIAWKKVDQVDEEFGENTLIALTSPDFESTQSGIISKGIRITINRSYHMQPEETIKSKLNYQYPIYDYNIRPTTLDSKDAMTMHEDYQGHNRFIFAANGNYLWQIAISSKSLEDEQKYEVEIANFLASVKFKN